MAHSTLEGFLEVTKESCGIVQRFFGGAGGSGATSSASGASGGALPAKLAGRLEAQLDALAASAPADYHPGSGKIVQDVIHPSMFCFVDGRTELWERTPQQPYSLHAAAAAAASATAAATTAAAVTSAPPTATGSGGDEAAAAAPAAAAPRVVRAPPHKLLADAECAWLPAEVDVSADGEAR